MSNVNDFKPMSYTNYPEEYPFTHKYLSMLERVDNTHRLYSQGLVSKYQYAETMLFLINQIQGLVVADLLVFIQEEMQ